MAGNDELDLSGGATQEVVVEYSDLAHSYLELQVLSPEQQEVRLPFIKPEIELAKAAPSAFPSGTDWIVSLKGEEVELARSGSRERLPLTVGTSVDLDGVRVRLLDARRPPVGTLLGLSSPYVGRVWNLTDQQTWLGRKGKRLNHIEVNHSTISRTHATFVPDNQGNVELLVETSGAPTLVDGEAVEVGKKIRLQHGVLISFGEMLFRFSVPVHSEKSNASLKVKTLGTFQVSFGGRQVATAIKNEKAQFLLAALAAQWGEPLSVDWVLAQFWPEVETARGRKNLSYTVVQLRENFGIKDTEHDDLFLRSTSTLQLNPERLESHDYTELKRLTETRQALTSRSALERTIALYGGQFLPFCYEDWAETKRQTLEREFHETMMRSGQHFLDQKDFDTLALATGKLLELDPMNEEAAGLQMEGALMAARPELATSTYEKLEKSLKAEGLEPSIEVMKIYYRANLGL